MTELPHDNNPLKAQRVKVVHTYRDISGHNADIVSSSRTLLSYLGISIDDKVGSAFITNIGNGVLYIEPAGTAGPDSFPVPPGAYYEVKGRADQIRLCEIYAEPQTTIGVMLREVYQ